MINSVDSQKYLSTSLCLVVNVNRIRPSLLFTRRSFAGVAVVVVVPLRDKDDESSRIADSKKQHNNKVFDFDALVTHWRLIVVGLLWLL